MLNFEKVFLKIPLDSPAWKENEEENIYKMLGHVDGNLLITNGMALVSLISNALIIN